MSYQLKTVLDNFLGEKYAESFIHYLFHFAVYYSTFDRGAWSEILSLGLAQNHAMMQGTWAKGL